MNKFIQNIALSLSTIFSKKAFFLVPMLLPALVQANQSECPAIAQLQFNPDTKKYETDHGWVSSYSEYNGTEQITQLLWAKIYENTGDRQTSFVTCEYVATRDPESGSSWPKSIEMAPSFHTIKVSPVVEEKWVTYGESPSFQHHCSPSGAERCYFVIGSIEINPSLHVSPFGKAKK